MKKRKNDQQLYFADLAPPPPPSTKISKDAHYIAVSQMQKAIRVGAGVDALRASRILWVENSWLMFKRLNVILGEDCGRDHELIRFALTFFDQGYTFKKWEDVALLVVMMAASKAKSHESGYSWWAMGDKLRKEKVLRSDSPVKLLEEKKFIEIATDFEITKEDYVHTMSPFFDSHLCGKLYNLLTKVDDRERQLRIYPLWFHDDKGITQPSESELFAGLDRKCGDIMLNALDSHTRAGGFALRVLAKKMPMKVEWDELRFCEWFALSGRLNAKVVDGRVEAIMAEGREEITKWFVEHVGMVMDVREWALKKTCPAVLEEFKNADAL